MVCTILMCCALLGADRSQSGMPSSEAVISAYEAARSQVGRDPNAHVRLALWCESHGLRSERMKHLALAVLYNPSHALARGLLGMLSYQGKWARPEVVGPQIQNDPAYRDAIREYLERRPRTADKADAQLKLAAWCEQKGLKAQALTHYEQVIQLDPTRDTAWKHLGFKKQGNRWVKADQAAATKLEAERQKQADKHWRPILEKLRDDLRSKDTARRARAERQLADVTGPRAVPMIWGLFILGTEGSQVAAVSMLSQIEGPAASNALAALAIFSPRAEVQRRASESLTRRDLRDILTRLIGLIRKQFKYQVRPVSGPGSTGVLFVEGEKFNVRRVYRSMSINPSLIPAGAQSLSATFNDFNSSSGALLTTALMLENHWGLAAGPAADPFDYLAAQVRSSALSSQDVQNGINQLQQVRDANATLQQSLAQDVQAIEAINAQITQLNSRVLPIVEGASGQKLGAEPAKWKGWWTDQLGYAFQASQPAVKPTFTDIVDASSWSASLECFGQGTQVHAAGGPRPIETIEIGDRVLTQNTSSGVLSYQPVMAVHRTKTAATYRIAVDGETIVATGIHRFWRAGKGWTMARDLKAGDRLRMPGSVVEVRTVGNDKNQTVYNLDVAENSDFFVGRQGILVHDSNFVKPVSEPFDVLPN
jgi:tetratricopeptide (TPR) repeat protein